jgi:restriction system protein
MDITFHYPPELMSLLIDTVPLLCRSKQDTLLFLKGAGVADSLTSDLSTIVRTNRGQTTKYAIVRTVLTRLNERGEAALRERREVLKRIIEFDDFSTCWESDRLKAQGLVAQIQKLVNVKDSFTRMNQERETERRNRLAANDAEIEVARKRRAARDIIKRDLFALFGESNPQKRGKALEGVLNRLFAAYDILIRESFVLRGADGEGVVEQIDGVIELDGHVYLVEMKWTSEPIGPGEVAQHLVRVFGRGHARGLFISASSYTDAAILTCRESLRQCVFALCKLEEVVLLLERQVDLQAFLKAKINAAIVHKNPMHEPLLSGEA